MKLSNTEKESMFIIITFITADGGSGGSSGAEVDGALSNHGNQNTPSKPGTPKPLELGEGKEGDPVYAATTSVVRAVMDMTRGVQQAKAEQYIDLVKVLFVLFPYCLTSLRK